MFPGQECPEGFKIQSNLRFKSKGGQGINTDARRRARAVPVLRDHHIPVLSLLRAVPGAKRPGCMGQPGEEEEDEIKQPIRIFLISV